MNNEFVLKKCMKCGALVKIEKDCLCEKCTGISCCGEEMKVLVPNSEDAAVEKHVPNYEVNDNKIIVTLNHPAEEEHFIDFIALVHEDKTIIKKIKRLEKPEVKFCYIKGATIYAYCNKHGIWKKDVK